MIGYGYAGKSKISNSDILEVQDLDAWLDDIQNDLSGQINILYDALAIRAVTCLLLEA